MNRAHSRCRVDDADTPQWSGEVVPMTSAVPAHADCHAGVPSRATQAADGACHPAVSAEHTHHAHHLHHAPEGEPLSHTRLTTAATLHCLTGCAVGEWIGLAAGVSLGLDTWATMVLATTLGFVSGYVSGLWPLVRQGMGWMEAWRTIWLGETVSIAVMEIVMNTADWHMGGMQATSVLDPQFWLGFGAALVAGFIAAWPVNAWLLRRNVKKPCH